jgi:hypothetical protein
MPNAYSPSDAFTAAIDADPNDDGDSLSLDAYIQPLADRTEYNFRRLGIGPNTRVTVVAGATTVALASQPANERCRRYTLLSSYTAADPLYQVNAPSSLTRADGDMLIVEVIGDRPFALGTGFITAGLPSVLQANRTYTFAYYATGFVLLESTAALPARVETIQNAATTDYAWPAATTANVYDLLLTSTFPATQPAFLAGDVIETDFVTRLVKLAGAAGALGGASVELAIVEDNAGALSAVRSQTFTLDDPSGTAAYQTGIAMKVRYQFPASAPIGRVYRARLFLAKSDSINGSRSFVSPCMTVRTLSHARS